MRARAARPGILGVLALGFVLLGVGRHASAQGVGFEGGATVDPEQFYVGSHYETAPLVDRLHFRPGVEGGFGGGLAVAAINAEFLYKYQLQGSRWSLYQGGGPAVNIYRIADQTDIRGGINAVFGLAHASGFFLEFKAGGSGSPGLRFGVGYTVSTRRSGQP